MQLSEFNQQWRERILDLLWRQWTALGVQGNGTSWKGSPIDPDALVVFSCTAARRDARLFDAIVEWMQYNGRYLGVTRVRRMLQSGDFAGTRAFLAAVWASADSENTSKWKRLASRFDEDWVEERLFQLADGGPTPLVLGKKRDPDFLRWGLVRDRFEARGVAGRFDPRNPVALLLRLRALLGVNARCDILLYLMLHSSGTPRAMARACGYEPMTVVKALNEMGDSGMLDVRQEGRHTVYRIEAAAWHRLLVNGKADLAWIDWRGLFGGMERIGFVLDQVVRAEESERAQASAIRRVLEDGAVNALEKSGLDWQFGKLIEHPGAALLPHFIGRMDSLLQELSV